MIFEARLIAKLRDEQARLAHDALRTPRTVDAGEYARVCGMYAGFERAIELLAEVLADADAHDRSL